MIKHPKLTLSNEIWLLLLIGLAALLALPLYHAMKKPANTRYYLLVNDISGIQPENTTVYIKGMAVGNAEKAELYRNNILLTLSIRKNIRLPRPAVAQPGGNALGLSATVIDIEPDSNATAYYEPGDTLYNLQFIIKDSAALRKLDSVRTKMMLNVVKGLVKELKPAKTGDSIK